MHDPELCDQVKDIITKRSDFIIETIERGRRDGTIKSSTDSQLLEHLITGAANDICLKWRMDDFKFSIKDRTTAMLEMLLEGFIEKRN